MSNAPLLLVKPIMSMQFARYFNRRLNCVKFGVFCDIMSHETMEVDSKSSTLLNLAE